MRFFNTRLTNTIGAMAIISFISLIAHSSAFAVTESVIWSFGGAGDGDASSAASGLIEDGAGNLYGTTLIGGTNGVGVVFELSPPATSGGAWTESVLWSFGNGSDGQRPLGGLLMDPNGNLFGTTFIGGSNPGFGHGAGTLFELSPPPNPGGSWTESVLWEFGGANDVETPSGDLIADDAGNLYGLAGGGPQTYVGPAGSVFELSPPAGGSGAWTESVLWIFGNTNIDGLSPRGTLALDRSGNLYGTTVKGGPPFPLPNGFHDTAGTAFELSPPAGGGGAWTESIIWNFGKHKDGSVPFAGPIIDARGNLYGTTGGGGTAKAGTVFKLTAPSKVGRKWRESRPWSFGKTSKKKPPDGTGPGTSLIMDGNGNLYGTTPKGGTSAVGIAFELSLKKGRWQESILWNFGQANDGTNPGSRLLMDNAGNLFGTTTGGGALGKGTVFEIQP